MSKLKNFTYGDIALSQAVLIDEVPYVTRQAIGEFLDYEDPIRAISKLLERNPHIDEHSVVVKLTTTDGKNYETNVYHPIGFLLIVMESGQPKAKDKKVEVAEFVWHFSNPGTERLSPKERRLIQSRISTLTMQMSKTKDALVLTQLHKELRNLCDKTGEDYPNMSLLGQDFKQAVLPGFNDTAKGLL